MKYFIALTNCEREQEALDRACEVLKQGHSLERIFFLKSAVELGSHTKLFPQWQAIQTKNVELILCSAALERRELSSHPDEIFSAGGLGLYAEALIECDQVEHFG